MNMRTSAVFLTSAVQWSDQVSCCATCVCRRRSAGEFIDLDPSGPVGLSLLERLTEPVEHIHNLGHVQRDISCRNVMVSEDCDGHFNPYLIDLGMAYDMRMPPTGWGCALTILPVLKRDDTFNSTLV